MFKFIKNIDDKSYKAQYGVLEALKYIGPGLLVTVGFIDPGNWASNLAAGADYGYTLLWMVTLSTIMLIILQHNVAHLGISTGLCLSEAISTHMKPKTSKLILFSAMAASISTSLAEILGGAIALQMLFKIPIKLGAILCAILIFILLLTNSYKAIEKFIIAFVSIIGLSFLYELSLVYIDWPQVLKSSVTPAFPKGSMIVIMSVLGAVVMPHNLFLHSEVIQSRQWNKEDEKIIKKQLKYEFLDTLFSMGIGWAINSAMIILAASAFFKSGVSVETLEQSKNLLEPLLGKHAGIVFAVALLFAGISSTTTSAMAAGSIFAGAYKEPFDMKDNHSKLGVLISILGATIIIFFISNPFKGLIISQVILSIQLPITIFSQVFLTSSEKVMGTHVNSKWTKFILYFLGIIVTILNIALVINIGL